MHTFIRFAKVGAVGFIVDAGVLEIILRCGLDFYTGRIISFLSALTTTWYMNRRYTFSSQDSALFAEWFRFFSANSIGGIINVGIYSMLVATIAWFEVYPTIAVGIGSAAGLLWNFSASSRFVFRS